MTPALQFSLKGFEEKKKKIQILLLASVRDNYEKVKKHLSSYS